MRASLGDIFADIRALADASGTLSSTGGLGPWLSKQLGEFRALPGTLSQIVAQARAVRQVLAPSGVSSALDSVNDAEAIASGAQAEYPAVAQNVNGLMVALVPVMPKINAGQYDADVISTLLRSGVDIVGTIHRVNDLLAKRDDARNALQSAVMNPTVPENVRGDALSALSTSGSMGIVKVLVVLGIGYVIVNKVIK